MKTPNLKVIDLAIKFIETNRNIYSCCALRDAVRHLNPGYSGWARAYLYRAQYEKYVTRRNHGYPTWWNEDNSRGSGYWRKSLYESNKAARIRALKGFRQACID